MKVFHIGKYLPTHSGGVEFVTELLAMAAKKSGAKLTVSGVLSEKLLNSPTSLTSEEMLPLKSYGQIGPVSLAPGYFNLEKQMLEADVIHLHMPNPFGELALLKFLKKYPNHPSQIVPVLHAGILRFPPLNLLWEKSIQKLVLDRADSILVSSLQIMTAFPAYKKYLSKAVAIPFPTEQPLAIERKNSVPSKPFSIVSIGRLVPYKGYEVLIKAAALLKADFQMSICGEGPQLSYLQRLINQHHLSDRVTLTKAISSQKKADILTQSDLFILASTTRAECYGMSIAEAFSYRLPVITTSLPTGVSYLARQGESGAIVPPGNAKELSIAIESLIKDDKRRESCANSNFHFWQENLQFETFCQRYSKNILRLKNYARNQASVN